MVAKLDQARYAAPQPLQQRYPRRLHAIPLKVPIVQQGCTQSEGLCGRGFVSDEWNQRHKIIHRLTTSAVSDIMRRNNRHTFYVDQGRDPVTTQINVVEYAGPEACGADISNRSIFEMRGVVRPRVGVANVHNSRKLTQTYSVRENDATSYDVVDLSTVFFFLFFC